MISSLRSMPGAMRGAIAIVAIVATLVTFSTAQAQSVRLLGDFNDWSAYTTSEGTGKLCFVVSKPTEVDPRPDGFSDAYLYLTHRPGENVRNEFNLVAGFTFAPDSTATVTIGSSSYELFTEGDAAWLEDTGQSDNVAANMRAGTTLVVEGTTQRGIKVSETFSLSGVTAASRAIDAECR